MEKRQQGIALVTALMMFAIATILAVEMSSRLLLDIRRGANVLAHEQALSYAVAAELWGLQILKSKLENNPDTDHLGEDWARPMILPEFDGVRLSMQIRDAQAKFNINNLLDEEQAYRQQFQRLLELHNLDPNLVNAVLDWLDPDQEVRFPSGAEDDVYTVADPPYRSADRPMADISELRVVAGFQEAYRELEPYLTALPTVTTLNVNTASAQVLRLIDRNIDEQLADNLTKQRPPDTDTPYADPNELLQHVAGTTAGPGLGVRSDYFELHISVELGPARVRMRTLVGRRSDGTMTILARSQLPL